MARKDSRAAASRKAASKKPKRIANRSKGDYAVSVDQRIRFKTEEPVSVEAVIASLRGMDRIVKTQLPKAIRSVTGAHVKSAEVKVSGLEDGSFIEDFKVKLLFKSKEDYERFVESAAATANAAYEGGTPMLKIAIGGLVAALVGALVLGGLGFIGSGGQQGALANIEGDNNTVIVVGAEAFGQDKETFKGAINKALDNSSSMRAAQAALDVTAPAREQGAAVEIVTDNERVMPIISKETAASLPRTISSQDESEDASYENVKVQLRAYDSDSVSKGWAGSIPGLIDSRTRITFADSGDAAKSAFQPQITADVTVTYSSPRHDRAILIIVDKVY